MLNTYVYFLKKSLVFTVRRFFHGSGSGFFLFGSGFSADPDLDSGKKVLSGSGQKDPDPKHWFILLSQLLSPKIKRFKQGPLFRLYLFP